MKKIIWMLMILVILVNDLCVGIITDADDISAQFFIQCVNSNTTINLNGGVVFG